MTARESQSLRDHLLTIADDHRIEIIWVATTIGRAHRDDRYVRIPEPSTPLRYLIGLHELGHCIAPRGWWGRMVDREAVAWQWAFQHSMLTSTPRLRAAVKRRLDHYVAYAPSYGATVPDPDADFWRFYHSL